MSHCNTHKILTGLIQLDETYEITDEEADITLGYLEHNGFNLKYGDLIEFKEYSGYRNEGIFIFDGERIINLGDEEDEYGNLPNKFKVLQANKYGFTPPLHYWHNINDDKSWRGIEHNYIVWFDHYEYIDQIKSNIRCDNQLSDNQKICYTYFNLNDTNEVVYIILDDVVLNMDKETNVIKLKEYLIEKLDTEEQIVFSCLTYYDIDIPGKITLFICCDLTK